MDNYSQPWSHLQPDSLDLQRLLALPETEYCDRKRCFHENNAKLLHDIVCLCNAYVNSDRFLLFGVADDGRITGIEHDPNAKSNAQLHDLARQSHFNRIPSMHLSTHQVGDHVVAVLHIKNRPDKPFFFERDYREGQHTIRAGVIYTRVGDTNTPLKECAPEDKVELMWRERFGVDLKPLDRLRLLLGERDKWMSNQGDEYLYHEQHPEFVIRRSDDEEDFCEPWTERFPDSKAHRYEVCFYHYNTVLRRSTFVSCDGGRYQIPLPRRLGIDEFELYTDTMEYMLAQIYHQYRPLDEQLAFVGVQLISGTPPTT